MATKTLNFATLTAATPYVVGGAPDNLTGYTKTSGSTNFTIGLLSGVNQFYGTSSSSNSVLRDDTLLSGAQYSVQVTIGTTNGSACGPALLDSSNNGYVALSSDGTGNTRLFKVVASQLGAQVGSSVTQTHTDNQLRELRWTTGGIMSMWVNGVQIGANITDTTYTPTYAAAISRAGRLRNMSSIYTPAQTVTSINSGNPFAASQTASSAVTTGFSGLPTTITSNATGLTFSNIGGTTNAPTFTKSVRTDGAVYPKDGVTATVTFVNGAELASITIPCNKNADETKVVVASPINDDITCLFGAIFAATGRSAANGDEIYHVIPAPMLTNGVDTILPADAIQPNGEMQFYNAGAFDCWVWTAATGVNYYYRVTITESGGIVIGRGLTSSGLTSSGLTSSGLTSTGL
jgi:hypothetical protein